MPHNLSDITIHFSESILRLTKIFIDNGFSLYAVGGAVRDKILQHLVHNASSNTSSQNISSYNSKQNTNYDASKIDNLTATDIDFTTNALPSQILEIFPNAIPTGIKHGTLTIKFENNSYEVTTFRTEGKYEDHRHPDEVKFTSSLALDLSRRDFTINAMACNPIDGHIIDYHQGLKDLQNKTIHCVGNPLVRFEEDALRMLRAIRFAAKLNFNLEPKTEHAILACKQQIEYVSKERISSEIQKMLESAFPDYGIALLAKTLLLEYIFTEITDVECAIKHLAVLKEYHIEPAEWLYYFKLASLFTETQKLQAILSNLKTLRFSNTVIEHIMFLLTHQHILTHNLTLNLNAFKLKLLISKHSNSKITFLLHYLQTKHILFSANNTQNIEINTMLELCTQHQYQDSQLKLAIDGNDICKILSKNPGPWLGSFIATLQRHIFKHPEHNNKKMLKTLLPQYKLKIQT